jgi:hypothetical protein
MEITFEILCAKINKMHKKFYEQEEKRTASLPLTKSNKKRSVRAIEDVVVGYKKMRETRDKLEHLRGYNIPYKLYDNLQIELQLNF